MDPDGRAPGVQTGQWPLLENSKYRSQAFHRREPFEKQKKMRKFIQKKDCHRISSHLGTINNALWMAMNTRDIVPRRFFYFRELPFLLKIKWQLMIIVPRQLRHLVLHDSDREKLEAKRLGISTQFSLCQIIFGWGRKQRKIFAENRRKSEEEYAEYKRALSEEK